MKKNFTLLKMMFLAIFMTAGMNVWADTYTHTFASGDIKAGNNGGTVTLSGVNWTFNNNGNYYGWDNAKGIQIGSSGNLLKQCHYQPQVY